MHEHMEKVKKICEMKDTLCTWMSAYLSRGCDQVNVEEAGQVVDMIKDLADAEKNIWKACYYKKVVEAMEEGEDDMPDEYNGRMGYDNYRYMSSGRYAPKGHGTYTGHGRGSRRGYIPNDMMNPTMVDETMRRYEQDPFMAGKGPWQATDSRFGKPFQDYQSAKRHYTETHDQHDRDEMDSKAVEHMADMIATMKEIWNDATPALKKQMASDLKGLTAGMTM